MLTQHGASGCPGLILTGGGAAGHSSAEDAGFGGDFHLELNVGT